MLLKTDLLVRSREIRTSYIFSYRDIYLKSGFLYEMLELYIISDEFKLKQQTCSHKYAKTALHPKGKDDFLQFMYVFVIVPLLRAVRQFYKDSIKRY